jgi:hypothetical protein
MFLDFEFQSRYVDNMLTTQLDIVVRMYAQHSNPMKTFPFATTIRA